MKLVIDRAKWLRGEGGEDSRLLRTRDEKMCCLGFFALECGYSKHEIAEISGPERLAEETDEVRGELWLLLEDYQQEGGDYADTDHCERIIDTNDDITLANDVRERALTSYFKEIGVEVEFIN